MPSLSTQMAACPGLLLNLFFLSSQNPQFSTFHFHFFPAPHLAWTCFGDYNSVDNVIAGVAQLVEHDVANVVVDGSNPFARSFSLRDVDTRKPKFHRAIQRSSACQHAKSTIDSVSAGWIFLFPFAFLPTRSLQKGKMT